MKIDLLDWAQKAAVVSTVASITANVLPKADVFADYPKIKRAYQTLINIISALAVNLRFRTPSLDLSIPGYGLTKPPGSLPAASVEEIRAGQSQAGAVHPPDEVPSDKPKSAT